MGTPFNAHNVDLDTADPRDIICYLNAGADNYNGQLGARISAIFVILVTSTMGTLFPVLATRVRWLRIPSYIYLFVRCFGAGVVIATAFIHLLDPAYEEIGPASCVGMTGSWAEFTWPPCIALISIMLIFLLDFGAEQYVSSKCQLQHGIRTGDSFTWPARGSVEFHSDASRENEQLIQAGDRETHTDNAPTNRQMSELDVENHDFDMEELKYLSKDQRATELCFKQRIAGFLVLEFGVVLHSVIIGLNLGVVGDEFSTLYLVLVFHQTFEGLGIGARLSGIPFPRRFSWMPWALCLAYGVTTPISITIGILLRNTYQSESFAASVVSGLLDSVSAGILMYTGLVEMLAKDFLLNPDRARNPTRLAFMLVSLCLGVAIMTLLGKWA